MKEEFVIIENKKYIPLRAAAKLTGYAKDYLGQLSRGGHIEARRLGRAWFVSEESVLAYKSISLGQLSLEKSPKQAQGAFRPSEATKELFALPLKGDEGKEPVLPQEEAPRRIGIISHGDINAIHKARVPRRVALYDLFKQKCSVFFIGFVSSAKIRVGFILSPKKRFKIRQSRIVSWVEIKDIFSSPFRFLREFLIKKKSVLAAQHYFLVSTRFRFISVVLLMFLVGFWIGDARDFLGNTALRGIAKARDVNFYEQFHDSGKSVKGFFAGRWEERTESIKRGSKTTQSRAYSFVREFGFNDYAVISDIFVENIGGFLLRGYNNVSYILKNSDEIIESRVISFIRDNDKTWGFYSVGLKNLVRLPAASVEGGDRFINVFSEGMRSVVPRIVANYDFYLHDVAHYIRSLFTPDVSKTELVFNYGEEFDILRHEFEQLKKSGFTIERIITEPNIIERTILREIAGISEEDLHNRIQILRNELLQELARLNQLIAGRVDSNTRIIQLTQAIHELESVTLTNVTVNGITGLTDADIPNNITVNGYLELTGGTLTGNLIVTSPARIGVGTTSPFADISAAGLIAGDYFYSASTTATSTFNGGIQVLSLDVTSTGATSTFANGIQLTSGCFLLADGSCAGTGSGGSGTINPGTVDRLAYYSGATTIDSASLLSINNTESVFGFGTTTPSYNSVLTIGATSTVSDILTLKGLTSQTGSALTIQDSASTTLYSIMSDTGTTTIAFNTNATTTINQAVNSFSIAQYTTTDPPIFSIDGLNQVVGIGTSTPDTNSALSVQGNALISGTTTVNGLIASSSVFLATDGNANVGIGTFLPQYTLDVTGTIRATQLANFDLGFISSASSTVDNALTISGALSASSTLAVAGLSTFDSGFISSASSSVTDIFNVGGALSASSTLAVSGLATFDSGFIASASSSVTDIFNVGGALSASSTLAVASLATFDSGFVSAASSTVVGPFTASDLYASSTLAVGSDAFVVTAGGNIGIGTTTPTEFFTVDGDAFITGSTTLLGTTTVQGLIATSTIHVRGSATSTIDGGLDVGGLRITSSAGAIESLSLSTSTFANGITLTEGCFQLSDGTCAGTNADTVDGLTSADFLRSNASDEFETGNTLTITGTLDSNGDISIEDTDIAFDGASTNFTTTGNFSINTSQFFINQATGFTGIATVTPSALFSVQGDALISGTTTMNGLIATGTALLAIDGGNVGIGTASTNHKLTILGDGIVGAQNNEVPVDNNTAYAARITGDTFARLLIRGDGRMQWGPGDATQDIFLERISGPSLAITGGNIGIGTTSPSFNSTLTIVATSTGSDIEPDILTLKTLVGQDGNALVVQDFASSTLFLINASGGLAASASSTFSDSLNVTGAISGSSTLAIAGLSTFDSGFISSASSTVVGPLTVSDLYASSTLAVTGASQLFSTFDVLGGGLSTLSGGFVSQASSTIDNTLTVSGALSASSTLAVAGLSTFDSGFISSASSTVTDVFNVGGALSASSTLAVSGLATFDNGFLSAASSTVSGDFTIGQGGLGIFQSGFISQASSTVVGDFRAQNLYASSTLAVGSDALIVTAGGNVGIGTAAPGSPLEIIKTGTGAQIPLTIRNDQTAAADVGTNFRWAGSGDTTMGSIVNAWEGAATTDAYTAFYTRGGNTNTEKARITSSGNLGIATTTPASLFSVHGDAFIAGTTTVKSLFATSTIVVEGAGTSTFTGGISSGGLQITSTAGAIESLSNSTSTFTNGIDLIDGCFSIGGACVSGGGGGTANPGTADRLAYYSASTVLDSANSLVVDTGGGLILAASSSVASNFYVQDLFQASSTALFAGLTEFDSGFISRASSTATTFNAQDLYASSTFAVTGASQLFSTFDVLGGGLSTLSGGFVSQASSTVVGPFTASDLYASSTLAVGSDAFVVTAGGSIGIGTTTPTEFFTVDGDAFITGSTTILGTTTVQGLIATSTIHVRGSATSTIDGGLDVGGLRITSTAGAIESLSNSTSTFANGITLTAGCFQLVDGTCAGTNADTVDGLTSADFLRSNASDEFETGNTLTITGTLDSNGDISIEDTDIAFDGASTNFTTTGNFSINTSQFNIIQSSGYVGIGTTTPTEFFTVDGDAFITGSTTLLGTTTVQGLIATSTIHVRGSATSTIDGGLDVGGLRITSSAGAIESLSLSTSTFANGIKLTAGTFQFPTDICAGFANGGVLVTDTDGGII
ncbi:MAG: hypothetical protein Q8O83_03465, partial [bacterium]|nr:hypothetical protein [bacterium]